MAQRIGDPTCDHSGHVEPAVPGVFGPGVVCSVCALIMPPKGERASAPATYPNSSPLMGILSRVAARHDDI